MRKLFSSKKSILTATLVGLAAVVVITIGIIQWSRRGPATQTTTGTIAAGSSAQSSSEEEVDTTISLAPKNTDASSALPNDTASSPSPSPGSTYAGCDLDLAFIITGGNLDNAGNMQYELESKNVGGTTCASPSISVYYANDETYASSNPSATADGYYWSFPDLAPGAVYDITLVANRSAPLATGAVVDEACLSANNGADSCSNASAGASLSEGIAAAEPSTISSAASIIGTNTFTPPPGKEFGVWVWTPVDQMTTAEMQEVVSEAAANNFNAIYLTIDDRLTATDTAAYDQSLENFIGLAKQQGISVDAEAGARDWAENGNTSNAGAIMSFVTTFNQSHTGQFRGVQYDIEPYLLPQYQTNQSGVLTDYVNLIENLVSQDKLDKIPLTIIVPDFYTATQQWTPEITVDGITAYTYDHIVRLLNELPGSRIIVMAYRNTTLGPNGSIALAAPEVQGAEHSNVAVLVAQETGPVTPSYVTFNGLSRSALFGAAATIDATFASDTSFDGIAVDYLDPFLNLP